MRASIISIGDELLIGQVIDSNSAQIARALGELAIPVVRKWSVGDSSSEIAYALQQATACSDVILMTGGLGPTRDDVTKKELAAFFNASLHFSEENYNHLRSIFEARGLQLTEAHTTQCMIPSNALLLPNKVGTAMGLWMEKDARIYVAMPGVPDEMMYILREELIPRLRNQRAGLSCQHTTLCTVGYGETDIALRIEPLLKDMPEYISIAYLPAISQVRLRLTGIHHDEQLLKNTLHAYTQKIREELKSMIYGEGDTNLALELGKILMERGLSLGTAESCTGGALAAKLTANAGSSDYFRSGIVSYATDSKIHLLGLEPALIAAHGVVSAQVAEAMVRHAAQVMNVDRVIATTGIAGPSGGTEDIPVGTVFIAAGSAEKQVSRRLRLSRNRERNIEAACMLSMELLRTQLIGN
ncbi:MAG: CinA family nicotinamide mononucleotide deamidase-related protein [Saprospiraceae bacterium]